MSTTLKAPEADPVAEADLAAHLASGTAHGNVAQTRTTNLRLTGAKLGIGIDPAGAGAKRFHVAQTGVQDWAAQIDSDWNGLQVKHSSDLGVTTRGAVDLVNLVLRSTGDAIFAAHQGGDPQAWTFTANRTSGSATLTSVSSFTGLVPGTALTGTGISAGARVGTTNTGAGTLTMVDSAGAPVTATSTGTGFTVTVPQPSSGTPGGDAVFNALVPYTLDDTTTGRAGTIVNNRQGMKGLHIETQAVVNGSRAIDVAHFSNDVALYLNVQPSGQGQPVGTGGGVLIDDNSAVASLRVNKNAAPSVATVDLAANTANSGSSAPIDMLWVRDSAAGARFRVRSDGTVRLVDGAGAIKLEATSDGRLSLGSNQNLTGPLVQNWMTGAGIQRPLTFVNAHNASGDGSQVEFLAGDGFSYSAQIQAVGDTVAGNNVTLGSLRFLVNNANSLVERLRLNGTGVGFFGATPVAKPTLPAAATDLASVITLANALRTSQINYGLAA